MVYYLKYRPQTLDEIIGQENVKSALKNALSSNHLAHAYLFCGPRGTGKTSTARILAKMVNCLDEKNIPCNKCTSCLSITDGSNLDLIEIDAASNRGIDDIRSLREGVKLSTSSARKKVYIIDEVHMLTTEAFNALLKTLEEPPPHVLFILATTEAHKIPATILSRVQRLDFSLSTEADLHQALDKIIKAEKLEIEPEALKLIAKKSEGSLRDAEKILDQLAASDSKITLELVENSLKSGNFGDLLEFIQTLTSKDTTKLLNLISKQVELGVNIKEYLGSIIDILRQILLLKYNAYPQAKSELGQENFQTFLSLASKFEENSLTDLLSLLLEAQSKMKTASIQSLPLEIAIAEYCFVSDTVVEKVSNISLNKDALIITEVQNQVSEIPEIEVKTSDDLNKLTDRWTYILETIRPYNYSLEALLKQVKVASVDEGIVLFEVPYSFHQRILEAPKSRNLLESVLSDVLGKQAKVSCVLGKRPTRVEELANVELAADDEVIKIAAEIFNS